jgi:hypothetical protein
MPYLRLNYTKKNDLITNIFKYILEELFHEVVVDKLNKRTIKISNSKQKMIIYHLDHHYRMVHELYQLMTYYPINKIGFFYRNDHKKTKVILPILHLIHHNNELVLVELKDNFELFHL